MFGYRQLTSYICKILTKNTKSLVRVYINGKWSLKVTPSTFWDRTIIRTSKSSILKYIFGGKMDTISLPDSLTPPCVAGMKSLDKSVFKKKCMIPGIKVPNKSVGIVTKKLKSSLIRLPKLKNVAELENTDADFSTHRLVLLDPVKYESSVDLGCEIESFLKENGVEINTFKHYDIELCYDNWSVSEIIKALLPELKTNISGFSVIGHIAHLNLKDEALDFKDLIGKHEYLIIHFYKIYFFVMYM